MSKRKIPAEERHVRRVLATCLDSLHDELRVNLDSGMVVFMPIIITLIESYLVQAAIRYYQGDIRKASYKIGVSPEQFRRLLRKYKIRASGYRAARVA